MGKDEVEIDLREIFYCIRANLLIIILATMSAGMLFYYVSSTFIDKKFESSTKFYVLSQQDKQTVTYSDLQTGTQLTKDYVELVTSRTVMMQVLADLDLQGKYEDMKNITPDRLASMVGVETKQDTRIVEIKVTDVNPTRAQDIADAVRVAASKHISNVMDIEAVNVVDYANLPEGPISPNVFKMAIVGAFLGMVISVVITIILYILDDTLKTPDDIENYLGISVLASIPFDESMDNARKRRGSQRKKYNSKSVTIPVIK